MLIEGERLTFFGKSISVIIIEAIYGPVKRDRLLLIFDTWELHRVWLDLPMIISLLNLPKLLPSFIWLIVALLMDYLAIILLYRPTIDLLNYLWLLILAGGSSWEDDFASILNCTTNTSLCDKVICTVWLSWAENVSLNRTHLHIVFCVSGGRIVFFNFNLIVSTEETTFRCVLLSEESITDGILILF